MNFIQKEARKDYTQHAVKCLQETQRIQTISSLFFPAIQILGITSNNSSFKKQKLNRTRKKYNFKTTSLFKGKVGFV